MFFSARPKRTGNYKPGPGRPPGRKNNRTLELEAAAREAAAGIDGSFEGDAHAFLASVYKNPRLPLELRILAASRALRVEKPVPSMSRRITASPTRWQHPGSWRRRQLNGNQPLRPGATHWRGWVDRRHLMTKLTLHRDLLEREAEYRARHPN